MIGVLERALATYGMISRGGFRLDDKDRALDGIQSDDRALKLVGNAGPAMGDVFRANRPDGPDPLDRWTRAVIAPIAAQLGARAVYPFEGPPYFPFMRWAQRAEPVFPSPIMMTIHPEYGLWHAYRAALIFQDDIQIPVRSDDPRPCDSCVDKPCLATCPVSAFTGESYLVDQCKDHLRTESGADCMDEGCRARRACPVGTAYYWGEEMAGFHMHAFRK